MTPENGTAKLIKQLLLVIALVGAMFAGYFNAEARIADRVKTEMEAQNSTQDLRLQNIEHALDRMDGQLTSILDKLD